jgi:hypothetical protein
MWQLQEKRHRRSCGWLMVHVLCCRTPTSISCGSGTMPSADGHLFLLVHDELACSSATARRRTGVRRGTGEFECTVCSV